MFHNSLQTLGAAQGQSAQLSCSNPHQLAPVIRRTSQPGHHDSSSQHGAALAAPQGSRSSVACAAASVAGLGAAGDDAFLQPYAQLPQQQQHQAGAAAASGRRLQASMRTATSYTQLLGLLQDCSRDTITADWLMALLFRASQLARRSAATATAAAGTPRGKSQRGASSGGADALAAQQLVIACLQLLLEVNEQIGGQHLANCLLSLGVLCGRRGPAAPVMAGAAAAAATVDPAGTAAAAPSSGRQQQQQAWEHQQQHQQPAGVLQQLLISPARSSRRDLESLLRATGPQYQVQQLLHLTRATAVAAAQPQQLVDMMYGLAVLRLRPAPDVLARMLLGLQDSLQAMQQGPPAACADVSARQQPAPTVAAAARGRGAAALSPKQLSQLLWSAATLQVHLPQQWLQDCCGASLTVLPLFGAQDVANTCWALATLQQQQSQPTSSSSSGRLLPPPHWQLPAAFQATLLRQAAAAAGSMTGQGVANTLWGVAVLQLPADPQALLALLQRGVQQGSKLRPQEFANIVWGAARSLQHADAQLTQHQQVRSPAPTADADAAAAAAADSRQLLLQLLQQFGPELAPKLQPRDWSNIIWGAGFAGVRPDKTLMRALWRKTPAGFSTSLNPHYALGAAPVNSTNSNSSGSAGVSAAQAALLNPGRWSPQALANTLWGCAQLRVKPPKVWLQGFEAASAAVLAWFSDQHLANTLWAFGELRQRPSDAWLQLFWQRAGGITRRLLSTAAAAAGAGAPQHQQRAQEQEGDAGELQRQQQHVVQVLQACARLGVEPPAQWLQDAASGLHMAASALLELTDADPHQQQHQGLRRQQQQHSRAPRFESLLLTYPAAVLALAELAHSLGEQQRQDSSGSGGSTIDTAITAGQQLLQMLCAAATFQQQQQQLPAEAVLSLLLCLPKLQLPSAAANAVGASLLWSAQQQDGQQLLRLEPSQLAQLAFAVAEVAWAGGDGVWLQLLQHQQQPGSRSASRATPAASSTRAAAAAAAAFTDRLAAALTMRSSSMSAVDLRFSVAAVAKLQSCTRLLAASSVGTGRTRAQQQQRRQQQAAAAQPSAAVVAFTAAGGAAVGSRLGELTPHQRAVVAASLAQLGFSPGVQWIEALLHYSGCDLSECRSGDLVRLIRGLPLLLHNMEQQQQLDVQDMVPQLQEQQRRQIKRQQGQQRLLQQQQQQQVSLVQRQLVSSSAGLKPAEALWQQELQRPQMQPGHHRTSSSSSSSSGSSSSSIGVRTKNSPDSGISSSSRQSKGHAVAGLDRQLLREWVSDWLSESEGRLQHLSGSHLVAVGQGLARLDPWLRHAASAAAATGTAGAAAGATGARGHPASRLGLHSKTSWQQQQQLLPSSWQQGFLEAAAARLAELSAPELLMLLGAVRRLRVAAGPEWCGNVAATAAAAAATVAAAVSGEIQVGMQLHGPAEDSAGTAALSPASAHTLQVHHVGWLAGYLQRLGCLPGPHQQQPLLHFVAAACDVTPAAAAAAAAAGRSSRVVARPVPPQQLWQAVVLLAEAGWAVDAAWVAQVQGSAAGARLRAWLGQRQHLGTWQQLWGRLDQQEE